MSFYLTDKGTIIIKCKTENANQISYADMSSYYVQLDFVIINFFSIIHFLIKPSYIYLSIIYYEVILKISEADTKRNDLKP